VYILQHYPSGSCVNEWAFRYGVLLDRYQHLIRIQLHGHRHEESFELNRDIESDLKAKKVISVSQCGGVVTTYRGKNPQIRMYEIDADTFLPIKSHTYILDLAKASLTPDVEP
jgi:hypothetical protein